MKKQAKKKRGPKADVLKIEGDWRSAMKKALEKKPPKAGWSKQEKGRRR